MADERPIWQRIETDTDKSFAAFCVYRDLGADRSLEKVSQGLNKSIALLGRWSSEHNWVERAAAYDVYLLDEHRRERETRQKVVETNAWNDYLAIRKGIAKRVRSFELSDWSNTASDNINALLRLMKDADDYARRAVNLPDKITENKTDVTSNGKEVGTADSMAAALLIAQQQLAGWKPDGSGKS